MPTVPSRQDLSQRELLQPPSLRSGFNHLYQQPLVASESASDLCIEKTRFPRLSGKNVLLVLDTEDAVEVGVLGKTVEDGLAIGSKCIRDHASVVEVRQVYNEQGVKVLANRIQAMVNFASQNQERNQTEDVGNVIIGAIQGYVRTAKRDGSGAAFEILTLYNATTGEIAQSVSDGVPLQAEYLIEAREKDITYGSVLDPIFSKAAQEKYGYDLHIANDWSKAICGQTRRKRLLAAAGDLKCVFT
ncbi:hypothetical protein AA0121_g13246 [Alternaria tenuissima]|nr:hypothetical protein AA0121_g13246 [Alternaria tenuissima]